MIFLIVCTYLDSDLDKGKKLNLDETESTVNE